MLSGHKDQPCRYQFSPPPPPPPPALGDEGAEPGMRLFLLHSYTCKLDTETKDLETQGSELKAVVHRQSEGIAMRVFQSFGQDIQNIVVVL